jgi:putative phage-type endonuclease
MALTKEQLKNRAVNVGGSESSVAIGLNPYESSVELWLKKRGELPEFAGNEPTKWGQRLEPLVRQEYAEQTGRVVRLPSDTLHHSKHEWMVCHPDGVTDDRRLYEGKTARFADGWGEPGTDQVPEQYIIQVQHNMCVMALPIADLAVLIGGSEFRLYTIAADAQLQESIVEAEQEFLQHVTKGTRPPLDYSSAGIMGVLRKLYPGTDGRTLLASPEIEQHRKILEAAKAQETQSAQIAKTAKALLLDFMGNASALRFADGKALRRKQIDRAGYTVGATSFIDARFVNSK